MKRNTSFFHQTGLLVLISITTTANLFARPTSRQVRNIEAFTRLYGYVQYFHPSDEAPQDWALVAIYGHRKMLTIKDDDELLSELKNIFHPIAPAVKVFFNSEPEYFSLRELTPGNPEYYQTITWQHLGFGLPMYNNIYKSVRTNRSSEKKVHPGDDIFKKQAVVGEFLQKQITSGISCIVPYALYTTREGTYPKADTVSTKRLTAAINNGLPKDLSGNLKISGDSLVVRLADITIAWNILKHSFPYWEDASKPAGDILTDAIQRAFTDQTTGDFLNTLKLMCAPLNDGHLFIELSDGSDHTNDASAPLILTKAEGKIVVKEVLDTNLVKEISKGDIIDSIDYQSSHNALLSREGLLSGSAQWKEYKGLTTLLNGPGQTTINLVLSSKRGRKSLNISRSIKGTGYRNGSFKTKPVPAGWIEPHIYYINLSEDSISDIQYKVALTSARAIIFDLRGYPLNDNAFNVISHLLKKSVKTNTFFTPEIIYPDFEKITYQSNAEQINPLLPHLNAKIYFLTDASAQSASETLLSSIKDFKLATIIGQPTSGTNGNINMIYLPGRYQIGYTGLLTKNNDGSKHHLAGIIPDVIVNPTCNGIGMGKDEILEQALRMAR
ncbi:hypothetical protein TH53_06450 [Pedobacter lusitanus]|uniref:Tail specific protease domain-containing protein n=1 Tax=Pedobacter lusitanus TaxID=1503925 RepID=A0A0D0GL48_9SPHI|nr:S41 family peptidase [Pedobacter lusitanus]KIO77932.1 hypothetical protein TH53_06450 [Pedobacter lusitanus]